MKIQLLRTMREVVQADSDPVRQALFDHLRSANPAVKFIWNLHRVFRNNKISSVLVFLYGAKSYATADTSSQDQHLPLIVAIHKNAQNQGQKIESWLTPQRVSWLSVGLACLLKPRNSIRVAKGCLRIGDWSRLFPLVNRLNQRHDFLVSCRSASAIFCYARAQEILEEMKPCGIIVSSDSNPEPLAFTRAAASRGVPSIFMSHAYPTPVSPRLRFTLSILQGEAALQSYQAKGAVTGNVIFCGAESKSQPMNAQKLMAKHPVIGIFASKVVCWQHFVALIEDCRSQFNPEQILIRWHPNMLGRSKLASRLGDVKDVVETDPNLPLQEVAQKCDWVIADENSNVNLGVLNAGIPILPMKEFSVLPESRSDLYGFVGSSVIPRPVKTLRDVSLEQLAEFYTNDWAERFERYDASYLQPEENLQEQAREAIIKILSPSQRDTGQ